MEKHIQTELDFGAAEAKRLREENARLSETTCTNCDGMLGWEEHDRFHPVNKVKVLEKERLQLRALLFDCEAVIDQLADAHPDDEHLSDLLARVRTYITKAP